VGGGEVVGDPLASGPDAPRPWYQQPGWIGARSLVIPGWGQASNGAWIKAGIVAATETWMILKVIDDSQEVQDLKDQIANTPEGSAERDDLLFIYDQKIDEMTSHRWWLGGIVLVAVVDAYVDAHFRGFKAKFDRDPALEGEGKKSERVSVYYRWTF
jgi:hypothetical protein